MSSYSESSSEAEPMATEQQPAPIHLHQFNPGERRSELELDLLISAWNTLQKSSMDAALAADPSVFEFQAKENCLYFATIHLGNDEMTPVDSDLGLAGKITPYDVSSNWPTLSAGRESPDPLNLWSKDDDVLMGGSSSNDENFESTQRGFTVYDDDDDDKWSSIPGLRNIPEPTSDWSRVFQSFTVGPRFSYRSSNSKTPFEWHLPPVETVRKPNVIGIIYLLNSPSGVPSEVSLGIALIPSACGKGYGEVAVMEVLKMAFDQFEFHRVQVSVLEGPTREHTLKFFVGLGFVHEGMRRRAVMVAGPGEGEESWRDVHHLGMLDVDWAFGVGLLPSEKEKGKGKAKKKTRWDEMFARHQREREDLVGYDEKDRVMTMLKRTLSTETLRPTPSEAMADSEAESMSEAERSTRSVSPTGGSSNPFLSREERNRHFGQLGNEASQYSGSDLESGQRRRPDLTLQERELQHRAFRAGLSLLPAADMVSEYPTQSPFRAGHTPSFFYGSESESEVEYGSQVSSALGTSRMSTARTAVRRAVFSNDSDDMDSDEEGDALLPRMPRNRVFIDSPALASAFPATPLAPSAPPFSPQHHEQPPLSDYESESDAERYTSCADSEFDGEEEEEDEIPEQPQGSSPPGKRASDHIPHPLLGLMSTSRDLKRRRIAQNSDAGPSGFSHHEQTTPIGSQTAESATGEGEPQTPAETGSSVKMPLTVAEVAPPPMAPSLSYMLREPLTPPVEAMDSDLDSEAAWDLVSDDARSNSSFSLQSASSDSE